LEFRELESKKQFFFESKINNWDESIKGLNELLLEINHNIRELRVNNFEIKEIQRYIDLYNSTKLTLATTYLYNKKYEMGKRLVDELIKDHPNYLRPYIKKLEFFHTRAELDNAKELYDTLERRKNELTEEKDKAYFKRVREAFLNDWEPYQKVILL
jgi:DNA-binding transcriptional MerR regulator